jgi:small GTP-binding protein
VCFTHDLDWVFLDKKASSSGGSAGSSHRVKLVAVGDGAVGKTSLLITFATDKFPPKYVPTVFENHTKQMKREKDGSNVILQLWDTAGQEDYDRLRPLSYPGADVVLLCFSTVTRSSFESVKEKWHPEVAHYVPEALTLLVGTKIDLREAGEPDPATKEHDPVSKEEGESMKKSIKASKYLEVSAKTRLNLDETFNMAVELVLEQRRQSEAPAAAAAGDAEGEGADNASPRRATTSKRKGGCALL